ncbi:MAG: hypothetical protein KC425_06970, partial [Anaerolineales bacterium]|nr:hypothetical protein [Anaerolineales bacterium]
GAALSVGAALCGALSTIRVTSTSTTWGWHAANRTIIPQAAISPIFVMKSSFNPSNLRIRAADLSLFCGSFVVYRDGRSPATDPHLLLSWN